MKVTKRQLRRIIREEKAKVIQENRIRGIIRRRLLENQDMGPVQRKHRPMYPAGYRFEITLAPNDVDRREQVAIAKRAGLEVRDIYVLGTAEQIDDFARKQHDLIANTSADPDDREDFVNEPYDAYELFQYSVLPAGHGSGSSAEKAQAQADVLEYEGSF
jgi:hypothetical protein